MKVKVLMFGWEFPPIASGGLGTACFGLTKGLNNNGAEVIFVMPKISEDVKHDHVDLISAEDVKIRKSNGELIDYPEGMEVLEVDSFLSPYMTNEEYSRKMEKIIADKEKIRIGYGTKEIVFKRSKSNVSIYGKDLFKEVYRYRLKSKLISKAKDFDVIHCHDWMTYGAGIEAKRYSKKPLFLHIHATEFDRTANNPNKYVYDLEKEGFDNADKIFAVSNFTKNTVVDKYGIDPKKIEVVHNAVDFNDKEGKDKRDDESKIKKHDKIVLFLGRITVQKGPDWFIQAAKRALEIDPNITFVIAGSGDMQEQIIEKSAELGIAEKVIFTGFLRGKDIDKAYRMADLYVMPSVSEPFGITPLEAMRNDTPVLISKQSGVSEVINHCLKVDFWDIDMIVNKMIAVLNHKELKEELKENGNKEVKKFDWNIPAKKCISFYKNIIEQEKVIEQEKDKRGI